MLVVVNLRSGGGLHASVLVGIWSGAIDGCVSVPVFVLHAEVVWRMVYAVGEEDQICIVDLVMRRTIG